MTIQIPEFAQAVHDAEDWIADLMQRLGWHDPARTWLALRAASHALRDGLPMDAALSVAAQLPVLLRGVYVEGWRPAARALRVKSRQAFFERIHEGVHRDPAIDPEQVARGFLAALAARMPAGELEVAKAETPEGLRGLWPA
jgi:uncharacterized protein (DUF2267 family)